MYDVAEARELISVKTMTLNQLNYERKGAKDGASTGLGGVAHSVSKSRGTERYFPDPSPERQFINVCIPMQNHTPPGGLLWGGCCPPTCGAAAGRAGLRAQSGCQAILQTEKSARRRRRRRPPPEAENFSGFKRFSTILPTKFYSAIGPGTISVSGPRELN